VPNVSEGLSRELQISVGDCGKLRLNDVSGHCRASRALPAASQLGAQDVSGTTPSARAADLSGALPDFNYLRKPCRTLTASSRSQWALPDLNREL